MPHLRDILNELKWKRDRELEKAEIWYIHRGAPQDTKVISGKEIIDIGKSFERVIQGIGRGLRKAIDKDSVHVTDICTDFKYGKRHLTFRTKYYKEAKYPFKKQSA